MRLKILSPMLFLAAVSLSTPPVEADHSRWPGVSCQSVDNSSHIIFNTAGTVLNSDTAGPHTVICPVQMPIYFFSGDSISVTIRFDTSAAVGCTLRLVNSSGTTQESDTGTSSPQAYLGLSIQNDSGFIQQYSANLRCALPAASATLGAQGIVSYQVNYPD